MHYDGRWNGAQQKHRLKMRSTVAKRSLQEIIQMRRTLASTRLFPVALTLFVFAATAAIVCIPVAAAVESILGQTHRPIELIVVDDGSTDGTGAVLEQFSGLLRLITQANAGHAAARNAGIRASAGEYIAFLDADDLWRRDKLARQLRRLAEHPELGVTFSHLLNFSATPPPADRNLSPAAAGSVPGYTSVTMLARIRTARGLGCDGLHCKAAGGPGPLKGVSGGQIRSCRSRSLSFDF
jgi:hypothetical protein